MPSREEMWNQVADEVDLVVIGGGITGAGIALAGSEFINRFLAITLCEQQKGNAGILCCFSVGFAVPYI